MERAAGRLSGTKRPYPFGDVGPACKRRRQGDGGLLQGGGQSAGLGRVAAASGRGVFSSYVPSLSFLDGHVGPSSVFDCSSLTDALSASEFVSAPVVLAVANVDDESLVNIHVPGAASVVKISHQFFINQILGKLMLKLHAWGVVQDKDGLYTGWIDSETPAVGLKSERGRDMFLGDDAATMHEAMESAAADAVEKMVRKYDVIVKDLHYEKVSELQTRVEVEKNVSSSLMAELKKLEEYDLREKFVKFYKDLETVCKEFNYLVPIRVAHTEGVSPGGTNLRVVYDGAGPPVTSLEMLAEALVHVLDSAFAAFGGFREEA